MSARPRAKSARTPKHRIPIGLQLVARILDGTDADSTFIRKHLAAADAMAAHILHDPLITLNEDGANRYLSRLAERHFGAEKPANDLAAMIPKTATHDPHAFITDAAMPWADAGFYLGLALGYRVAAGLPGTEQGR